MHKCYFISGPLIPSLSTPHKSFRVNRGACYWYVVGTWYVNCIPSLLIYPPHLPLLPLLSLHPTLVRSTAILPHLPQWSLPKLHVLKDPSTDTSMDQDMWRHLPHTLLIFTTAWRRWRVMQKNSMIVSHLTSYQPALWLCASQMTFGCCPRQRRL